MHKLQLTTELIPDPQNRGYTIYCPEFDIMTQGDHFLPSPRPSPLRGEG